VIEATKVAGGEIIITADHGNAEQMRVYTTEKIKSQAHTAHTSNLVPMIYIGRPAKFVVNNGTLSDIAPTMLYLMGLEIPGDMTGTPLLRLDA
jgi:2,3-bisphosphoglycerate-independent phosphoglycerate mutase